MAEESDDFERGHVAGVIAARLTEHDKHFANINGSIAEARAELKGINLQLQRLGDNAIAASATVIATAIALEKAETARRIKSDTSWSPFQKVIAVIGPILVAIGLYIAWTHR